MKNLNVVDIVERYRQNGNSTWIIKSAIKNPECIILAYNAKHAKMLEYKYNYLLNKSNFFKKLKWKIFGRKHPKFLSKNTNLDGYKLPIIFDNSALFL